jgi:methylglutaconyl-CoA hydratase
VADDLEGLDAWRTRLEGEIRLCAPSAAAASKALIAAVAGQPVTDGLMHETARRLSEQRASPDAQEGIGAFLGRRKPAWTEGA